MNLNEKAKEIVNNSGSTTLIENIEEAMRQDRLEIIEECAKIADPVDDCRRGSFCHCEQVAELIRQLKKEQI